MERERTRGCGVVETLKRDTSRFSRQSGHRRPTLQASNTHTGKPVSQGPPPGKEREIPSVADLVEAGDPDDGSANGSKDEGASEDGPDEVVEGGGGGGLGDLRDEGRGGDRRDNGGGHTLGGDGGLGGGGLGGDGPGGGHGHGGGGEAEPIGGDGG